jgi:uncharacterized protein YjeT (DUF2065 family)
MARNGLGGLVPEHYLVFPSKQRNAIRKVIQRALKQLRAVGHPSLSICFIGAVRGNLTFLICRRKVGIC